MQALINRISVPLLCSVPGKRLECADEDIELTVNPALLLEWVDFETANSAIQAAGRCILLSAIIEAGSCPS